MTKTDNERYFEENKKTPHTEDVMTNNVEPIPFKTPERKTGRPRRQDNYEKVSFTISRALLAEIDNRAQEWGMNRSSAVARIIQTQTETVDNDENYNEIREMLRQINELVKKAA